VMTQVALLGEVSQKEAIAYYAKYGSVRKSLLAIEGKKRCRSFTIYTILAIILITGIIILSIGENKRLRDSNNDLRSDISLKKASDYNIRFPLIIIKEKNFNSDYDIIEIMEIIHNRPPEIRYWDLQDGLLSPNENDGQYCSSETHPPGFCSFCELPINTATACNSNSEDRLVCANGASSHKTTNDDFSWDFCRINNSSRRLCPSSKPFASVLKNDDFGHEHECSRSLTSLISLESSEGISSSQNLSSFLKPCPDASPPFDSAQNSKCETMIQTKTTSDQFSSESFSTPGIYRICDSNKNYFGSI